MAQIGHRFKINMINFPVKIKEDIGDVMGNGSKKLIKQNQTEMHGGKIGC